MKTTLLTLSVLGMFLFSGCAMNQPESNTVALQAGKYQGKVLNTSKMKGHDTPTVLTLFDKSVTLLFPDLDNNTGEKMGAQPCEAKFKLVGTGESSVGASKWLILQGNWPAANNNCALYVERTSSAFSQEVAPRYLLLEPKESGYHVIMSHDPMGRNPILAGDLK